MRRRLRTAWLEMGAGFHLLFAAAAAQALASDPSFFGAAGVSRGFAATLLLMAGCAVFMLHPFHASPAWRRGLFFLAGCAAAVGAVWFLSAGDIGLAALQAGYACWMLTAAFVPWFDQRIGAVGETRIAGIGLAYGATLAVIGAWRLTEAPSSLGPLAAAVASVAAGAFLLWVEVRGVARARLAATLVVAGGFLYHGILAFADRGVGSAGALLSAFAVLLLSVSVDHGLPEAADDLGGITPRQREIYVYERAGEAALWVLAALSAVFVNFVAVVDARLYFAAILFIALVTQYSYRLRPAAGITERRYLVTLATIAAASIVLMIATGGALGPFVYVAYLAIFAGTIIVQPIWSVILAVIYAGYVAIELALRLLDAEQVPEGLTAKYLFLATTLMFTGLYTAWTGRRRVRTDDALLAANRRLAEALRNAVRERERSERQALDLKTLNEDLLEMRSALMNVLEDVEESKRQIEAERRREAASFKALAEGVMAAGKDGRIFLCNPTAARILGMTVEEVIGKPIDRILRLFHEDEAVMQTHAFEEAYGGHTVALGERLQLTRADGSFLPVAGIVAPYLDEDDRTVGIVAAFRDVTVEREIDRQKSDFISIASHQLRTPLSALRWFLDLLLAGDAGPLKPVQKEYLGDMSVSVTRMVKLVGDLLNISRIESGRTKPNPERIDAHAFAESLIREFMPLVRQQEVAFTSSVAKSAGTFYADPTLARQAVANILSNAVKYTPAGGSVAFDVKSEGDETIFKVKDTGLGIPKSQQYRIFAKFFRGENVVAQETVGSGLGLYVVKTIVDLSGGRVWFESVEKKGTTFYMTLPNGPKALPVGKEGGTMAA